MGFGRQSAWASGRGERDAAVIPLADAEMKRSLPVSCDELSEVF